MRRAIRHNRWQGDAESLGRPYLAVAARFDLAPRGDGARAANGAIDAKVASADDVLALRAHAVLGPTDDGQPAFDWRAWAAHGYCDSRADAHCAAAAAAAAADSDGGGDGPRAHARGVIDVATLCDDDARAGTAADDHACPARLPCAWDNPWGVIHAEG